MSHFVANAKLKLILIWCFQPKTTPGLTVFLNETWIWISEKQYEAQPATRIKPLKGHCINLLSQTCSTS